MSTLKQQEKKPLTLQSLPKKLRQKFKNSIVFEKQNQTSHKKYKFDPEKIRKRKTQKQKTIQQKLKQYQINPTELKHLSIVFDMIANKKSSFGFNEINSILKCMAMQLSKADIDQMIWQFDQDLDKKITREKLVKMYKRCKMDKAAAQPKKLFHLTQFLMYCKPGQYRITVQDTLELLYVRALEEVKNSSSKQGVEQIFEDSIKVIFGEDYQKNNEEGVERDIGFSDYLEKINKKAIEKRKKEIQKIKSQLKYS